MGQMNLAMNIDNYDENTWFNPSTGEVRYIPSQQKPKKEEDAFLKLFKKKYEPIAMQMVGKENQVLTHIVTHLRVSDNELHETFKDISIAIGASMRTVASAMAKLKKLNFLCYKKDGEWIINPYVVMYGGVPKKRVIYAKYLEYKGR